MVTTVDSEPWTQALRRNNVVAHLVTEHRRLAGLTQEELSARSGLSTRAISDLERGRVDRPRRSTVEALVSALEPTGTALLDLLTPDDTHAYDPSPQPAAGWPHPLPRPAADLTGREQIAMLGPAKTGRDPKWATPAIPSFAYLATPITMPCLHRPASSFYS